MMALLPMLILLVVVALRERTATDTMMMDLYEVDCCMFAKVCNQQRYGLTIRHSLDCTNSDRVSNMVICSDDIDDINNVDGGE